MIGRISSHSKRLIVSLLILLGFSGTSLFSQKDTIINKYARVLTRSDYQVTVDDASAFSDGDYVLIIQMKGVSINAEDNSGYGLLLDKVGKPGEYEFLIINSKIGNTITFLSKIKKYDPAGFVQIVKVPFFNSASFNDTLTCKTWNPTDGTGGVLAMIVGRTLTLTTNIDVSGKGFRGGKDTVGQGLCADANGIKDVYSFPASFQNAGYKGEGISSHYSLFLGATPVPLPLLLKGQGQLFSGGGGGNGRFSGGGGGSNRGIGFNGGVEDITCGIVFPYLPISGGNGGFSVTLEIDTISNTGGVFMGGGGGSSTNLAGSFATSGGNGGGIIFIIADTIKGNNKSIIASGDSAKTATNIFSGAGGGGAGGSIMIFSQSYSSDSLKIKTNGAKGGDVYHLWATTEGGGPGGGGGGGYVALLKPISGKILIDSTGGGVSLIKYLGFDPDIQNNGGGVGKMRTGVVPVLTGFLFNSISSNVTGNQIDSICSNVPFGLITGTSPVGGVPDYTFLWESSTTSESAGYDTVPGIYYGQTYSPGLLTQTTWFRRVVTDKSAPVISDTSKPVNIIVQPAVTGNLVGKDTTICYNQNPLSLIPLNAGPSNGSSYNYYEYKWIQNTTNSNWNTSPEDAAGTNNSPSGSYDPPALTDTTYYQRVVTSGRCVNNSLTVTITVLPLITGNITARPDSVICEGSLFNNLGASAPGGGDLINYWYQWQDSTAFATWVAAPNTNDGTAYSADTATFSLVENRYYRRVVYSGPDSVCRNNSSPIWLTRFHKIKNNSILADQTICSGSAPLALTGSTPSQGSGVYTYVWQDSSKVSSWITRGTTDFSFPAPALIDTTWYRRIVNSSKCTNTSFSVIINVHKPILNNNISLLTGGLTDTTICNGQVPNLLIGTNATGGIGTFNYLWLDSTVTTNLNSAPGTNTSVTYSPSSPLTETTYYKRQVISGACTVISSETITVTVLQPILNNIISTNQTVCYNTAPASLTGGPLSGGAVPAGYSYYWEQSSDGGASWAAASGINTSESYQPPVLLIPMKYKRTVKSGIYDCTIITSIPVDIGIDPLPVSPVYAGPDVPNYYSVEKIFHMEAADPVFPETGSWRVLNDGTITFDDTTYNLTVVRNLSLGKNSFLWTVTNGPCKLDTTVNITLLEDFVPQGFSPNGDAWNNTFIIEGLNITDQIVELSIVNGAGTEVFSTSNRDGPARTDWDGKNSKGFDLPEGTYYYLLKITSNGGQVFKKSGFIVLKRY